MFGPEIVTAVLVSSMPAAIAAIAAIVGARISAKNGKKADDIHVLVNSNMTKVQSDLAGANERIRELQELISKLVPTHVAGEQVAPAALPVTVTVRPATPDQEKTI